MWQGTGRISTPTTEHCMWWLNQMKPYRTMMWFHLECHVEIWTMASPKGYPGTGEGTEKGNWNDHLVGTPVPSGGVWSFLKNDLEGFDKSLYDEVENVAKNLELTSSLTVLEFRGNRFWVDRRKYFIIHRIINSNSLPQSGSNGPWFCKKEVRYIHGGHEWWLLVVIFWILELGHNITGKHWCSEYLLLANLKQVPAPDRPFVWSSDAALTFLWHYGASFYRIVSSQWGNLSARWQYWPKFSLPLCSRHPNHTQNIAPQIKL